MNYAAILKTSTHYLINSTTMTQSFAVASAPYFRVPLNEMPVEIVEKIFEALESNKSDMSPQSNLEGMGKEYLKALGFKSLSELHKKSIRCSVAMDESNIYFTPTANEIANKVFTHLADQKEVIAINSSKQDIFQALERAFDKCE